MYGGVQAVAWTDVKQMYLIVFGLLAPRSSRWSSACPTPSASATRCTSPARRASCRCSTSRLDPSVRFTFWTGTIGALFLFLLVLRHRPEPGAALSHGQVGGRSAHVAVHERLLEDSAAGAGDDHRRADVRVLPVHAAADAVQPRPRRSACAPARGPASTRRSSSGSTRPSARRAGRRTAAGRCRAPATDAPRRAAAFRRRSSASRPSAPKPSRSSRQVSGDNTYNDVNYVFPTYIVTQLPVGLIGLLMAAIFAAAMSTIAGELSALSTSTVIDFYRRWVRDDGDEAHLLLVSKLAMAFWAVFASVVAIWAVELGSLIEVVNRFGSFFYGSILGVFLLAHRLAARHRHRRVRRADRRNDRGWLRRGEHDHRLPLAQPDRRRRRLRCRDDRQRTHRPRGKAVSGTPTPARVSRSDPADGVSWTIGEWLRQRKK